jgi:hypothetical protein
MIALFEMIRFGLGGITTGAFGWFVMGWAFGSLI